MKVGDLVVMPKSAQPKVVGLVFGLSDPARHRIGVLWSDGEGQVDLEPKELLEIVSGK